MMAEEEMTKYMIMMWRVGEPDRYSFLFEGPKDLDRKLLEAIVGVSSRCSDLDVRRASEKMEVELIEKMGFVRDVDFVARHDPYKTVKFAKEVYAGEVLPENVIFQKVERPSDPD